MRYNKPPLDFPAQIALLKQRGMVFTDEDIALESLHSISYFRLANYWKHFEQKETRYFKENSKFESVLGLYSFDQELRNIIFSSIQNIEIAFRTRVSHFLSMKYGAFWFLDSSIIKNQQIHLMCIEKLKEEMERSHEEFIQEHNIKYDEPIFPPSWKIIEVASFGTLSKLYSNITEAYIKKEIARSFQLPSYLFLENWMKCATVLRNCCAHHARLWNRRFSVIPKYPAILPGQWIKTPLQRPEKLYGQLCCLVYLEQSINPNSNLRDRIIALISNHPEIDLKTMGFQSDWQKQPLWE